MRSTDETTVYNADDGNSFISDDGLNYTIKDKDGKETELEFKGYETAYKANDGTECKLIAVDDKYILTKADGTKTVLTASEGEG